MEYPAYPVYRESGIEWLGNIPEHWETRRLKFSLNLISEKINSSESDEIYLGLENIESWTGKLIFIENMISEGVATRFEVGDVLFGKLRPYLAKALLTNFSGIATTELLVFRPDAVSGQFLLYYLLNSDFIYTVNSSTYGSKMPRASWNYIGSLTALIPTLKEQQTIAQFLDHKTQQIDQLIAKKQTLIDKLQEQRVALITHAVTKGLNPDVKMKDSGVEWLGEVPEHWDVLRAKFIAKVFVPQRNKPELNLDKDGLPWVTMENMESDQVWDSEYYVALQAAFNADSKSLPVGAVITSCVGSFGVAAINQVEIIINQQLQAFIPLNIYAKYLRYIVVASKGYFELIGTAATLTYVNRFGFEEMPVSLPPESEQKEIVAYLEEKTARIDRMLELNQQTIDKLKEYRTALITAAVTGKIDLRQWQKNKEAA